MAPMRSQESWARPGGPRTKSPVRGVPCVPGRGLFLAPLPHPVIGQEQPVGRVSSAAAELDVRAEDSGWCRAHYAAGGWRSARCMLLAALRLSQQQAVWARLSPYTEQAPRDRMECALELASRSWVKALIVTH